MASGPGRYVVPIPATKSLTCLADNAGAADVELSPADQAELGACLRGALHDTVSQLRQAS